jgi:hypothetical protein
MTPDLRRRPTVTSTTDGAGTCRRAPKLAGTGRRGLYRQGDVFFRVALALCADARMLDEFLLENERWAWESNC